MCTTPTSANPSSTSQLSFDDTSLEIPTKPGALLHYTYNAAATRSDDGVEQLLVCLNGLMLPQQSWFPSLLEFSRLCKTHKISQPAILTYDRWSQGRTTDRDPLDSDPTRDPQYGHDVLDAAHDLHQLLDTLGTREGPRKPRVIFVAHSIGCAIARVYAHAYPSSAPHAYIFLDSTMTDTDFVSLWPDPDAPSFDAPSALPEGVSESALRVARAAYAAKFHPSVPNGEHLDRRSLTTLLPSASAPRLPAPAAGDAPPPLLAVVAHDPDAFALDSERRLGTPPALTSRYAQARWDAYNRGLVQLTDHGRVWGVLVAPGCTHFVQRDNPAFVARVMMRVLSTLVRGTPLQGDVA